MSEESRSPVSSKASKTDVAEFKFAIPKAALEEVKFLAFDLVCTPPLPSKFPRPAIVRFIEPSPTDSLEYKRIKEERDRFLVALFEIASYAEGPVVTPSFDSPSCAKRAREALEGR